MMSINWTITTKKFIKYLVAGFAGAQTYTFLAGPISVETQMVVVALLLAGYNAVKNEWGISL